MHRFYHPPNQSGGKSLTLSGREAHHGLNVLRIREGEQVMILDGVGHEYFCEVIAKNRDSIGLSVNEKRFVPPLPYEITLLQAIPKGKIIESIIQKSVELGANRIVPLMTERVVVQLDKRDLAQKADK